MEFLQPRSLREALAVRDGGVVAGGEPLIALADLLAGREVEETREYHHRETVRLDLETGQGQAHVASPSPPTAPWSTSTPSSASSRWSRSPPPRTSTGR